MALLDGNMHVVYQTMIALSQGLHTMVSSMILAYTSPALQSMHEDPDFLITKEDGSWIGSVVPALAILGSLLAGPLLDNFGRRGLLSYLVFPFVLGWGIIATSSTVNGVIFGRMLLGICVGMLAVAGPVFTAETIQVELRRKLSFLSIIFRAVGISVSYVAGSYLSWRQLAWLGCSISVPSSLILNGVPETPFFLTRSGKKEESFAALQQLRKTSKEAEKEQSYLNESCKRTKQKATSLKELLQPQNRYPFITGVALMLAQEATGVSCVLYYASVIFELSGDSINPNTASNILSVLNFPTTMIGQFCANRCHRRSMIAASTSGIVLSLSILFVFLWARAAGDELSHWAREYGFIPLVSLMAFKISLALGWGPVPWIFLREGLPNAIRAKAASIIATVSWASSFLVTKSFQWFVSSFGLHYTFITYAVITGINGCLIHKFMPETYDKTAEQMEKLFLQVTKTKKEE